MAFRIHTIWVLLSPERVLTGIERLNAVLADADR